MLKEELLKMLSKIPDGSEVPFKQSDGSKSDPPGEKTEVDDQSVEKSKRNDDVISITAADLLRFVEAYSQEHKSSKPKEKEDEYAEVFIY